MSLPELSIRRPVFMSMVTLAMVVFGALALQRLPVELYPDLTFPVLAVRTQLPGAAPEEVEGLVTRPIEDVLSTVAEVKTLRSISREGTSIVILEFSQEADIKYQEAQVRAKTAGIQNQLPEAASVPTVARQDPDDTPVIELILQGNRPLSDLTDLAENEIARRLRQLAGVGEVTLSGEATREVQIDLRSRDLAIQGLSGADVVAALARNNRNDPVGRVEGQDRRWLVRLESSFKDVLDLKRLAVGSTPTGHPVFLEHVADVRLGFADPSSLSRFGNKGGINPAIQIDVTKQSGENAVAMSDRVQETLEQVRRQLPPDVTLILARDNADLVRSNVADVYESLIIAIALTIFVVLIFLRSPRSTFTTGLAIPSSIIAAFAGLLITGFSVNVMTLLALSLSIGLVVDDAIVVRENIFRHLTMPKTPEQMGWSRQKLGALAALAGTREVTLAVIATTATVVAVFLPVAFMEGVTGQFFKPFAWTVVFAMAVSLWDALTMAPMLSAYFANIPDPAREWQVLGRAGQRIMRFLDFCEHGFERLTAAYGRLLVVLTQKNWLSVAIGCSVLVATVVGFRTLDKSFLPTQLGSAFVVSLEGPLALPLQATQETVTTAHQRLATVPGLEYWTISSRSGFTGTAVVRVSAQIARGHSQSQKSLALVRDQTRRALSGLPGFTVRISEPADPLASGGARFQPIIVNLSGPDLPTLRQEAARVRDLMTATPGVADVGTLQEDGLPEVRLRVDRDLVAHYGITAEAMATDLSVLVQGNTSNQITLGEETLDVRVRAQNATLLNPKDLLVQELATRHPGNGQLIHVPLMNIVDMVATAGPTLINRENRMRSIRLGARTVQGEALGPVIERLETALAATPFSAGVTSQVQGQSEQMNELFANLVVALGLGGIFVYMVLASLFESLLLPFAVMAAIPMAAIGALAALLIYGLPLDLYGGIGLVLLAGIVAKNSILLVDFAVARVREGQSPRDALLQSAPLRLRPILMTSLAMAAGMLPVALGIGSGGAARQSLGVATIGGIISSTLLTLLVVPSLYLFVERIYGRTRSMV
jgi:hydrophobe/amphiphile efflux-1 (HAE1) family protein